MFRLFDNPLHLVLLLVIILIIFGAGKLPSVGSALGQSIKEFKKASTEEDPKPASTTPQICANCQTTNLPGAQFCADCGTVLQPQVTAGAAKDIFCTQCGTKNPATSKFCVQCGTGLGARAS